MKVLMIIIILHVCSYMSLSYYCNICSKINVNTMKLYNSNDDMNNSIDNESNEILEYDYSKGIVMKKKLNGQYKKVKDNRDMLPFSITHKNIDGTIESLGSWYLDASTSNGDILALGKKGTFVVQTVSFLYKFTGSSFKVFKKKLSVESISKSSSLWNENSNDSILQ